MDVENLKKFYVVIFVQIDFIVPKGQSVMSLANYDLCFSCKCPEFLERKHQEHATALP